jgi:hypothetical protein
MLIDLNYLSIRPKIPMLLKIPCHIEHEQQCNATVHLLRYVFVHVIVAHALFRNVITALKGIAFPSIPGTSSKACGKKLSFIILGSCYLPRL